jgi:hypothetical protein
LTVRGNITIRVNPRPQFIAINRHVGRRRDPELDDTTLYFPDLDHDIVANHNAFILPATDH